MKHLLKLERMPKEVMLHILASVKGIKANRGANEPKPLNSQTWAMIFTKSSTRTRVSFEVGIRELGGSVMFLNANDMQLGRGEPIKDTARVLGRMVHGAVIRTYAQSDVEEFANLSKIPTINALTDDEHPCQILTDIFTFEEARGPIQGKVVTYVGDGACNVPLSWVHAAAALDFELRIAAPKEFQPNSEILAKAKGNISCTEDIKSAVDGTDMVYTDVWVSMGMESEEEERLNKLGSYQINSELMRLAKPDALVMHCLPAYRGKEIDEDTFEANAETIFTQAENRLHTQKAILTWLTS
ncbi:MAG: ornithine carbamoyltransferase [Verrucomicrobiales bacterium]|nr:ornithine carbamoyltransferase [Verrucomicrobiales bacterium]|tara:strand:- start:827 stop:1723 length:897 start_codon:yes stop_codon:yes gene_type:complete